MEPLTATTTRAGDVKPCPFCGSTNVSTVIDHNQGFKWGFAECECGARSPEVRTGYEEGPDAPWRNVAMTAWNDRASLATAPEQVGEAVAAIRDRARSFVRDFSREVGFAMSDAQTEVMLNLFLRYADPIPVSGQELIDRVFKCVTEWVNDKNIQFDDQNALFRGLAYAMNPFEQKLPEDFVKDRKDAEAIRAFLGNAHTSTNVAERTAPPPASTNRLTDEPSTGICFFCGEPMSGKHEADCPQAAHEPLTDEQILAIARKAAPPFPWGIGSTKAIFLDAVRAIIAATEGK